MTAKTVNGIIASPLARAAS